MNMHAQISYRTTQWVVKAQGDLFSLSKSLLVPQRCNLYYTTRAACSKKKEEKTTQLLSPPTYVLPRQPLTETTGKISIHIICVFPSSII